MYKRQRHEPLDLEQHGTLVPLVAVVALVALSAVVEVVGHELVGFRHTMRVIEPDPPRTPR